MSEFMSENIRKIPQQHKLLLIGVIVEGELKGFFSDLVAKCSTVQLLIQYYQQQLEMLGDN